MFLMDVAQRIKDRRKQLGLSADDVATALGIDRSTVYRYESQEIEKLPTQVIIPLAELLKVSPAYLMGWEKEINPYKTKKVPLLGTIAAGKPIFANEEYGNYVTLDHEINADFALKIKGDSMIDARIMDGDIVFIHKQDTVDNGDIAAVMIDDEATLKRFYRNDGGIILKPENPKYQPRYYTEKDFQDIRILGKALLFQSKVR